MAPRSPFSTWGGILNLIEMTKPKSILDIGVGFGMAGFLIREYFDLKPDKKNGYAGWSIKIDGIEIFDKYITPIHKYIYDNIFIGNAITILNESDSYYDLILVTDVIEHLKKDDGYKLIELCKGRSDITLISTPYIFYQQDKEFFNEYEAHLSGWDKFDFEELGCRYMWQFGISIVAVFTEKQINLPLNDDKQEYQFDELSIVKIRQLVEMYYKTAQYKECIAACKKYSRFFPDDTEFNRVISLCNKKIISQFKEG